MQTGNISELFHGKQYGKIRTSDGKEAHFHKSCLWDVEFESLDEGLKVEFEIQSAYHGFLAFHIRPCSSAAVV